MEVASLLGQWPLALGGSYRWKRPWRSGANSREPALCLFKPESMVDGELKDRERPRQTWRHPAYTCLHRVWEQGLSQHPSHRSVRTSVVQRTQEGTMCPVWRAALELAVSEHCSFPEIPSGSSSPQRRRQWVGRPGGCSSPTHDPTLPGMSMEERNRSTRTWR